MRLLASVPSGRACWATCNQPASGPLGGVVLFGQTRGDAPASANRNALMLTQARMSALRDRWRCCSAGSRCRGVLCWPQPRSIAQGERLPAVSGGLEIL